MNITAINIQKTYKSIVEQIVRLIKSEELVKGDQLPGERDLADMFGVSRASVREALSALEIIGLIEIRQGKGTFITDLNIAPFINTITPLFLRDDNMESDLLNFRKIIELEAVRVAATKSEKRNHKPLENVLQEMKNSLDADDFIRGAQADINFHKIILEITDNYILQKAAECIAQMLESSIIFNREKILNTGENAVVLYNQHVAIYEAIRDGEPTLAVENMDIHLNFVVACTKKSQG